MKTTLIATLSFVLCLAMPASAEEWDYLHNDDLAFTPGDTQVYTTGNSLDNEWFGVRLENNTDAVWKATEVHFITAAAANAQGGDLTCGIIGGGSPRSALPFEMKIWYEVEGDVAGFSMQPGDEVPDSGFVSEGEGSDAAVNHITRVPLNGELEIQPGDAVRVGIRFRGGAEICTGQLVQDDNKTLGAYRNFLLGTMLGCRATFSELECAQLEDLGLGDIFGECEDDNYRWRPFNEGCDNPTDVPGVGATGDLAIRLARPAGGSTTPSDNGGPADTGTPDAGTPDVGTPDADVAAAPELTVTRVSPSMGPENLDISLQIFGTGFADGTTVRIGPASLEEVLVIDGTEMTATLRGDSLELGTYDVIAALGAEEYTFNSGYQVTDAEFEAPGIQTITPNSADESAEVVVTITGTNFQDDLEVLFGGRSGTAVTVNADGDIITVSVPTTLTAGVYDVEVENPDGQSDVIRGGWQVTGISATTPDSGCCAVAAGDKSPQSAAFFLLGVIGMAMIRRRRC